MAAVLGHADLPSPQQPYTGASLATLMVLARRIGQPRNFALVLLLYVATFGIYGIYWHYRAHREVYRQFELDLEGRDEGIFWLLLDRVFFPLRWVFQYGFVGNVSHVRRRMGLDNNLSPTTFLGLSIPGSTLRYGSVLFLLVAGAFTDPSGEPTNTTAYATFVALAIGAVAVGIALEIPAYFMLQRDLNGLWAAFDGRIHELMPPWSPPADAASTIPGTSGPGSAPLAWTIPKRPE